MASVVWIQSQKLFEALESLSLAGSDLLRRRPRFSRVGAKNPTSASPWQHLTKKSSSGCWRPPKSGTGHWGREAYGNGWTIDAEDIVDAFHQKGKDGRWTTWPTCIFIHWWTPRELYSGLVSMITSMMVIWHGRPLRKPKCSCCSSPSGTDALVPLRRSAIQKSLQSLARSTGLLWKWVLVKKLLD